MFPTNNVVETTVYKNGGGEHFPDGWDGCGGTLMCSNVLCCDQVPK